MIRTLYVDDEDYLLELGKGLLEREADITVVPAGSAAEALSILQEGVIDAIVSDYQMQGMDGLQLLKEVREAEFDTPFILFTGRGREEVAIEALNSGADFYLQKGGDPLSQFAELSNMIRRSVNERRTVRMLKTEKERAEMYLDIAEVMILALDRESNVIMINRKGCDVLGHTEDEVLGRNWTESFIYPEMRDSVASKMSQLFNGDEDAEYTENEILTKRGPRLMAWHNSVLRNANGETIGTLSSSVDITEARKAEQELRRSEEKYRHFIENAQEGVVAVDLKGRIDFTNPRAEEMFGRSCSELEGVHLSDLISHFESDKVKAHLEARRFGHTDRYDAEFVRKDGSRFFATVQASPILEGDEVIGSLGLLTDITDMKLAEEALEQANKKLNLLGSITRHDLMNQLTALYGYVDIAQSKKDPRPYLGKIAVVARNIQKLLEFGKQFEAVGKDRPRWIPVSEACMRGISTVNLRNLRIYFDLEGVEVYADNMLEKAFHNLADNSVRHGGQVSTIRVFHEREDGFLKVVFEDDGIGLSENAKARVFSDSIGHGLYLVRDILEITGMSIREVGNEGEGARFEILVPSGQFRIVS